MKKYFAYLVGLLLLVGGCSWSSLNFFGEDEPKISEEEKGVNHYLWQASLDKLSFASLSIEDKNSGMIETKWVRMEKNPSFLYKIKVNILSKELRVEGLQVEVEKKELNNGKWVPVKVDKALAGGIKNQILQRARILYQKDLVSSRG